MKQIFADFGSGEVKLEVETADDLWHLKGIIEAGDAIKGRTLRKVSSGNKDERAKDAVRKPMVLAVRVEKIDFGDAGELRAGGPIIEGPEDIPLGTYHTFALGLHTQFSLVKQRWLKFQRDRLQQALQSSKTSVLLVVMDREEAYFALLKSFGYELLLRLKGNVQKKGDTASAAGNFYADVARQLGEYNSRHQLRSIVIASPAFWKEDLMEMVEDVDIRKKVVLATCSSVGENGIAEVLKRPEVKEALKQERSSQEAQAVEELLAEISRQGMAAYGRQETQKACGMGAIRLLLVADAALQSSRHEGWYPELEQLMKDAEAAKGDVMIVSTEHDAGRQLQGIGGVGALLRFKMNY